MTYVEVMMKQTTLALKSFRETSDWTKYEIEKSENREEWENRKERTTNKTFPTKKQWMTRTEKNKKSPIRFGFPRNVCYSMKKQITVYPSTTPQLPSLIARKKYSKKTYKKKEAYNKKIRLNCKLNRKKSLI